MGWVALTSLISSCRCSSSEFCSLMKLNSAKLRSSTGEEQRKAGPGKCRQKNSERGTQKDRERGVSKDNTETKAERHGQRDIGREKGTETQSESR